MPSPHAQRWTGWILLTACAAAIAVATLTPGTGGGGMGMCLLCGDRGMADVVANVLLFVPLGVALGLLGLRGRTTLAVGLAISVAIEAAQLWLVPARDANLADVATNTLGAALGGGLGRSWMYWLLPPEDRVRRHLIGAALGCVALLALTGFLLAPALPGTPYHVQWTESPGELELYGGRVLAARVGGVPVTAGGTAAVATPLMGGVPLEVWVEAGPPASRPSQLLALMDGGREALFLGAENDDLLLRYHARSAALLLDRPALRLDGALRGVRAGTRVEVEVWRGRAGFCMAARGHRACPRLTPASGWALLQQADSLPGRLHPLLNAAWLALLAVPLGVWSRRRLSTGLALAWVALAVVLLPRALGVGPVAAVELIAGVAGWAAGAGLGGWVARRAAPGRPAAAPRPRARVRG